MAVLLARLSRWWHLIRRPYHRGHRAVDVRAKFDDDPKETLLLLSCECGRVFWQSPLLPSEIQ